MVRLVLLDNRRSEDGTWEELSSVSRQGIKSDLEESHRVNLWLFRFFLVSEGGTMRRTRMNDWWMTWIVLSCENDSEQPQTDRKLEVKFFNGTKQYATTAVYLFLICHREYGSWMGETKEMK